MGQITIFIKENCMYCGKVFDLLEKMVDTVCSELKLGGKSPCIQIKQVDTTQDSAYAALCIRLTGTFTVPHVFFNTEYVGDANDFCCLDRENKNGCNILMNKLKVLATKPNPDPEFPPPPDAQVVKVTESMAYSSQPTKQQMQSVLAFGLSSVLNIVRTDSPSFSPEEEALISASGAQYVHLPMLQMSSTFLAKCVTKLRSMKKPVLVHDDCGQRAAIVVLTSAAIEMMEQTKTQVGVKQLSEWCDGLGVHVPSRWTKEIATVLESR